MAGLSSTSPSAMASSHWQVLLQTPRRKISGNLVFLRSLDAYSDEAVPTHCAGAMDLPREACGAWMYRGEQLTQPKPHFRLCCHNGKLSHLWRVSDAPDLLHRLLTNRTAQARHFRDNIREYNAALSFVSFGASYAPPPGRGPPVYRINNEIRAPEYQQ